MPFLKINDIRVMTKEGRYEKLAELNADLLRLITMVKAGGSIENPADIKNTKKSIARILTVENEKKLEWDSFYDYRHYKE